MKLIKIHDVGIAMSLTIPLIIINGWDSNHQKWVVYYCYTHINWTMFLDQNIIEIYLEMTRHHTKIAKERLLQQLHQLRLPKNSQILWCFVWCFGWFCLVHSLNGSFLWGWASHHDFCLDPCCSSLNFYGETLVCEQPLTIGSLLTSLQVFLMVTSSHLRCPKCVVPPDVSQWYHRATRASLTSWVTFFSKPWSLRAEFSR